jgi:hypothetical protein
MHNIISVAENIVYKCVKYNRFSLEYNKAGDFKYRVFNLKVDLF